MKKTKDSNCAPKSWSTPCVHMDEINPDFDWAIDLYHDNVEITYKYINDVSSTKFYLVINSDYLNKLYKLEQELLQLVVNKKSKLLPEKLLEDFKYIINNSKVKEIT